MPTKNSFLAVLQVLTNVTFWGRFAGISFSESLWKGLRWASSEHLLLELQQQGTQPSRQHQLRFLVTRYKPSNHRCPTFWTTARRGQKTAVTRADFRKPIPRPDYALPNRFPSTISDHDGMTLMTTLSRTSGGLSVSVKSSALSRQ